MKRRSMLASLAAAIVTPLAAFRRSGAENPISFRLIRDTGCTLRELMQGCTEPGVYVWRIADRKLYPIAWMEQRAGDSILRLCWDGREATEAHSYVCSCPPRSAGPEHVVMVDRGTLWKWHFRDVEWKSAT